MTVTKPRGLNRSTSKAPSPALVRVAIYTRKSVTEGLDQKFNSLDAQRAAAEAYVQSQRGEGWEALPERYDDGGFTGANTDRPAFQRLLDDVDAGLVDVIAVYRLDRLSRSLLDFAKLMELLHARGIAFVSVTEHFDTTSPMGRMVLNLLATFAQFERETTAQRTRDKILASRRRGIWTGGRPVLGYDVVEKKLVVNTDEAERVRGIFALYLELGSLLAVVDELKRLEWKAKTWTNKSGATVHGGHLNKTSLHHMLRNPLYAGRIKAGDEVCDGVHEAIIDEDTWDSVQRQLKAHGQGTQPKRSRSSALLAGLVYCGACGAGMTPHFTKKGAKRYAYYVCQTAQKCGANACPGSRVGVGELEAFVIEQLRSVGRDPTVSEATLAADRLAREEQRPALKAEVSRLVGKRGRLESERKKFLDAIAASNSEASPALTDRIAELDEEVTELGRRIKVAHRELAALDVGAIDPEELRPALAELEPLWEELFPQELARVLGLLIERIEFHAAAGDVVLTFRPGGPGVLPEEPQP